MMGLFTSNSAEYIERIPDRTGLPSIELLFSVTLDRLFCVRSTFERSPDILYFQSEREDIFNCTLMLAYVPLYMLKLVCISTIFSLCNRRRHIPISAVVSGSPLPCRATLIVVPCSMILEWKNACEKFANDLNLIIITNEIQHVKVRMFSSN